jgi:hypothetical protein
MTPWYIRAILVHPEQILANLARVREAANLDPAPTEWQLCLGVLRLWHRVVFRMETVGTSPAGRIRPTWRARLLAWRALRLPCLLAERAVTPLDFTGLASPPEQIMRHLVGAHHDQNQFVYDLELLGYYGKLDDLRAEVRTLIERDDARAHWLRDLTVFDGYHESLLAAVERALGSGAEMTAAEARDPDISLLAYLRWCAQQPATPHETFRAWRAGTFRFDSPMRAA